MGGDEVVDAIGIGWRSELSEQVVHAVLAGIHGNFFSWRLSRFDGGGLERFCQGENRRCCCHEIDDYALPVQSKHQLGA